MDKIFLSHSSTDKPYVSYIANTLGKDRCVYDEMCFDTGMKTIDEIFRGLSQSSIFVVFISDKSLDSDWVQKELSTAEEQLNHDTFKLSQILPIIIDPDVSHQDDRIPQFLKTGFGSYNLRFLSSNKVAYRKIIAQYKRRIFDNNTHLKKQANCFYGRDSEIKAFKQKFDLGNPIKCVVVSGIEGIGRKSYITKCLKETQVINEYYDPVLISLQQLDGIEDLIVKLSEMGYSNHSIETVSSMKTSSEKIQALTDTLTNLQNYKEHVIVYDDNCIVDYQGNLKIWFITAINNIRNEVTISLASKFRVSERFARQKAWIFTQELSVLSPYEWNGLMRVYGDQKGVALSRNERDGFKDILTGYPPQVLFCIDFIADTSLVHVMKNSYEICEKFSDKVTTVLASAFPEKSADASYGLLSFLSHFGVVPSILLYEIFELNPEYQKIFEILRSLTICRFLGATGEYVEVNAMVSDYIQRNKYSLPSDIRGYIASRNEDFNKRLKRDKIEYEDPEMIKFHLKENLIANIDIPDHYMYSTIYLSAIYELYNLEKYPQIISIVQNLKDKRIFELYQKSAKDQIQKYYCMALAREGEKSFFSEVEYFHNRDNSQYHFLSGFMYRRLGEYKKALDEYKMVLRLMPRSRAAMREIVIVYKGLEDYLSAYDYAKSNYENDPENIYHIQPYFEILIRKPTEQLSQQDTAVLSEMIGILIRLNDKTSLPQYYELLAQHAAYIEENKEKSYGFLEVGFNEHPSSSYLVRANFDCCEHFCDIDGMKASLAQLKTFTVKNKAIMSVYNMRKPVLDSYMGKSEDFITTQINRIQGITQDSKDRLINRCTAILYRYQ